MSYRLQYIGPTQTFKAAPFHWANVNEPMVDIKLENGKQYLAELQQDGPMTIINGQYLIDPNTTIWIIFPSFGGCIPYSPEAILNQWRLL